MLEFQTIENSVQPLGVKGQEVVATTGEVWFRQSLATPLGQLVVTATPFGVCDVDWAQPDAVQQGDGFLVRNGVETIFLGEGEGIGTGQADGEARQWAAEAVRQLQEYFCRERTEFDLKLLVTGTDFQQAVWRELAKIPYGETRSYKDIATAIGKPAAVRAVGQANRRNPIAVVVPCHRVIGAGGQLVGYAGTRTHLKAGLLELEQQALSAQAR